METQLEYVVRKLNSEHINIMRMAKDTGVNRSKIYRVKNGGETSASAMQKLFDYISKLAD